MRVERVRGVAGLLAAIHAGRARGRAIAMTTSRPKLKGLRIWQAKWQSRPEVLLDPPIPEPMYGMAPRVVLGINWWNRTRLLAYKSTNYHCVACGVFKSDARGRRWLEAHERYEIDYLIGTMTYVESVPLCHYCHNYVHPGRMKALLDKGEMAHAKYAAIIQHGDAVLKRARLRRKDKPTELNAWADSRDWRLIVDGAEYTRKDYV